MNALFRDVMSDMRTPIEGKSPSEHHADHGHRRVTQTGDATPYDDGGSDLPIEHRRSLPDPEAAIKSTPGVTVGIPHTHLVIP
jgi:hypothetical protein